MTVMDAIKSRKSARAYKSVPVEPEKLAAVLEAGRLAPSASNRQQWRFYVVTNPQVKQQLMQDCRNQKFVAEAPVCLVVCDTDDRTMSCGQSASTVDCSIALSFMLLEAEELGLSCCWLGAFDAGKVRNTLNLPENETPVAVTPLGYASEPPAGRPRKALDEIVTYVK